MEHLLSNGVKFLVFGVAALGFSPRNAGAKHSRAKKQKNNQWMYVYIYVYIQNI